MESTGYSFLFYSPGCILSTGPNTGSFSIVNNPKIIFLDRDGVINRFPGKGLYVTRQEDFHFIPRSLEAIATLTGAGFEINVVSNQGCVSRGLISQADLDALTQRMLKDVEAAGGKINQVAYCVHQTSDKCDCKKPKTKLFHELAKNRPICWNEIYFVGDSEEDMRAARNLGCKAALVLSGRTQREDLKDFPVKTDAVHEDLWEAAQWIIQTKKF